MINMAKEVSIINWTGNSQQLKVLTFIWAKIECVETAKEGDSFYQDF